MFCHFRCKLGTLVAESTLDAKPLRRELIGMAFDMLLETGEDISVKVLSQKDFEARKGFSFLRNVISEGVKIA
jgi:hypothetical protein